MNLCEATAFGCMVINRSKFDAAVGAAALAVVIALIGLVLLYDVEIILPRG